jgi:hypothetical protein
MGRAQVLILGQPIPRPRIQHRHRPLGRHLRLHRVQDGRVPSQDALSIPAGLLIHHRPTRHRIHRHLRRGQLSDRVGDRRHMPGADLPRQGRIPGLGQIPRHRIREQSSPHLSDPPRLSPRHVHQRPHPPRHRARVPTPHPTRRTKPRPSRQPPLTRLHHGSDLHHHQPSPLHLTHLHQHRQIPIRQPPHLTTQQTIHPTHQPPHARAGHRIRQDQTSPVPRHTTRTHTTTSDITADVTAADVTAAARRVGGRGHATDPNRTHVQSTTDQPTCGQPTRHANRGQQACGCQ